MALPLQLHVLRHSRAALRQQRRLQLALTVPSLGSKAADLQQQAVMQLTGQLPLTLLQPMQEQDPTVALHQAAGSAGGVNLQQAPAAAVAAAHHLP